MTPFESLTRTPLVRFALDSSGAPTALYIGPDVRLRIVTFSNLPATPSIQISGLLLRADGVLSPFQQLSATVATEIGLTEGYLLNCAVFSSSTMISGDVFVQILLQTGATGAQTYPIAVGYLSPGSPVVFPGSGIAENAVGTRGVRVISGADPVAGAEWLITIPTDGLFRVYSVYATFVSDATALNRTIGLILDDGATVFAESWMDGAVLHPASTTFRYTWADSGYSRNGSLLVQPLFGLPAGLRMSQGFRLRSSTGNIQAGDNWSAPVALIGPGVGP